MKLGARILKTGIAITLALFLATLFQFPSPAFAGIAAIFAIQPTIYRSYLELLVQVQANIIGAVLAIGFGYFFGTHPLLIGLIAIIVISINIRLKSQSNISVALVTVIAILESTGDDFLEVGVIRFLTILLGILSAFIVNLVFLPPKYETKLYLKINENTEEIIKWIRINTRHASEHKMLKDDIEKMKENMIKLDQIYLHYKEERNYFKKETYAKSRKLVLFRQMIVTSNRALDTLKKLHRLENELHQMPEHLRIVLKSELDILLYIHEESLLRFIGKIKPQSSTEFLSENKFNKQLLIDTFMEYYEQDDQTCFYSLLPLLSAIIDYSDHLEHLNTLIDSFKSFHKDDNEIKINEE